MLHQCRGVLHKLPLQLGGLIHEMRQEKESDSDETQRNGAAKSGKMSFPCSLGGGETDRDHIYHPPSNLCPDLGIRSRFPLTPASHQKAAGGSLTRAHRPPAPGFYVLRSSWNAGMKV